MKWSKCFIFTSKEAPGDAEIPSHQLMLRAGYIKKLAPGIFTYGPLALRAIRKFEQIVREEHLKNGALELLMPMVHPRELWQETNRWTEMGEGLLKFKNRNGQDFCLGATHEEAITDFVRKDVKSYRDLPVTLFQIQTKFRDEIRPRFGLLRGREFIMKDAYSFDISEEKAKESYELMYQVYVSIFKRLGVQFRVVEADTGNIGGKLSHEFQILADRGEDQLLVSTESNFAANIEVCPALDREEPCFSSEPLLAMEFLSTPGIKTIAQLAHLTQLPEDRLVKTMFFRSDDCSEGGSKPFAVLLRGCDEVNPIKVKNFLGLHQPPLLLTSDEIKNISKATPGSCGPVGLNIPIYLDNGVVGLRNYIVGANREGEHIKNVNHGRDYVVTGTGDLRMAKEGDRSPVGSGYLKAYRGIEVGHIFYLGTKYSCAMNANYSNIDGKLEPIQMGCYGIGISRTVQAVIEQNHDEHGIQWPVSIAPFQVHICQLDVNDDNVKEITEQIYNELLEDKVEVFLDDRDERPGVKFKDADLLGFPLRLTIGARGLKNGEVECTIRSTRETKKFLLRDIVPFVKDWLKTSSENEDQRG